MTRLREKIEQGVRTFFIEFFALWFALRHPRVRWYARILILFPLAYIISPIDLIPDALSLFGIGQIDDLLVVRYSYIILKKVIAPDVLDECRNRANAMFAGESRRTLRVAVGIALAWIIITTLLGVDVYKRLHRRKAV